MSRGDEDLEVPMKLFEINSNFALINILYPPYDFFE